MKRLPLPIYLALLPSVCAFAFFVGLMLGANVLTATIGGTNVPGWLACDEDEVIAFDMSVDRYRPLTCVHIDDLR